MSNLSAFLHPVSRSGEKNLVISSRFLDEKGNPQTFTIKALTQEEVDGITRKSQKTRKVNGQMQEYLDSVEFGRRLVVAATVFPNFADKDLCSTYGTMDPLQVPGKMLLSGEYNKLLNAITELSGFDDNQEIEEQAKNW